MFLPQVFRNCLKQSWGVGPPLAELHARLSQQAVELLPDAATVYVPVNTSST